MTDKTVTISEVEYCLLLDIATTANTYLNIEHTEEIADTLIYLLWELDAWRMNEELT